MGGGSGWGTHVYPWLINVNVWQKPLQYCKIISLQLKKLFLSALKASRKFTKTHIHQKKKKTKPKNVH